MNNTMETMKKNKIALFLFLSIFFALPFERIPTVELFGFTLKVSYILILLFLLLILFSGALKEFFKGTSLQASDKALALFGLAGLMSIFGSPDRKRSVIILALWFFVFLVYLLFSRILTAPKVRKKAEDVLIWSSVLVCIFGLYQFIGDSVGIPLKYLGLREQYSKIVLGFPRIQSVALEPLYFSNFLMVPIFIVSGRILTSKKNSLISNAAILVLLITNLILGVSRGAYIGLGISMFILLAAIFIKYRETLLGRIVWLAGSILISAVLSLALIAGLGSRGSLGSFSKHSVANDQTNVASVTGRTEVYKIAWDLFKKKPIIGNGVGSFGPLTSTGPEQVAKFGYGTVNNEYLEILTETGLVGFLLFLLFAIFYLKELFGSQKSPLNDIGVLCLFLGLLAIFIQYNFFSTLYIIYIWAFLALLKGSASEKA